MTDLSLIIFDMDGTLVDSQANIVRVMMETFTAADIALPHQQDVRATIGLSLHHAMAQLLPGRAQQDYMDLAESYKSIYRSHLQENRHEQEELFDGVHDILTVLEDAGHLCAIATGKSRRGVMRVFADHNLDQFFQSVQTADDHPSKPHPSMIHQALKETGVSLEKCLMVGDTAYDMLMARDAGVLAVGAPWGYHDVDELNRSGAQVILRNWAHLADVAADLVN